MAITAVEMRCPSHNRMFGKAMMDKTPQILEGNLIEFACKLCRDELQVEAVFHRYNFAGELVETKIID